MLIPLKLKYREAKQSGQGRSQPGTNNKAPRLGFAALMNNEKARDIHFAECAVCGWYEQIPSGMRAHYQKRADEFKEKRDAKCDNRQGCIHCITIPQVQGR